MELNCDRSSCGDHSPGECDHPQCPSRNEYTPQVGHAVAARRRVKSNIYKNLIVGPVVDVWSNACRILTNPGIEIGGDFRLYFSDWKFQYLHDVVDDA